MKNLKNILLSLMLVVGVASAEASNSSHYFDPEYPGHGVSKTYDSGQGSAFIWYLYNRSGDARWLITTSNCMSYPCDTKLAQAFAPWMGGETELVEVGSVSIDFIDGILFWEYDLQAWPEAGDCGRLVWVYETRCVGEFKMEPID